MTKSDLSDWIAALLDFTTHSSGPLLWLWLLRQKILLQELWLLKGNWDDPLPPDLRDRWIDYHSDLTQIGNVRIPR